MIVLAGLPGAGKSTLAQRLQSLGWVIINQVPSSVPIPFCQGPSPMDLGVACVSWKVLIGVAWEV